MSRNCLTCRFCDMPGDTPELAMESATCQRPVPLFAFRALTRSFDRHIDIAALRPESEYYMPDHAERDCPAWESES